MSISRNRVVLEVRRDDFSKTRFVESTIGDLAPGQVLLGLDRFALTSNNITYAAAGDMLDYWGFFPAEEGWGRVPAMGFADVAESNHPDVAPGARYFGFFPMSTHLVVEPDQVDETQFIDKVAHREKHAIIYRQYANAAADPNHSAEAEDRILLLRGLFMTSFLIDSFLADKNGFGAQRFVVGSASSKTAIALAFLLAKQGRGRVVGVTSPRNRSFVEGLGLYDETIPYDGVESLPADSPTVFVDMSGNGAFVSALHHHLRDQLKYSCMVGATHWNAGARPDRLPGPDPAFFFAPGEIKNRVEAWGPAGFQQRLGEGWSQFCASSEQWLRVVRGRGRDETERVYQTLLRGEAKPDEGHVLSMWDES